MSEKSVKLGITSIVNGMKYSGHYHVMLLGTVIILHYKTVTKLFYSK